MKFKIINNTDLSYEKIGNLMDGVMKFPVDTNYVGKCDKFKAEFKNYVIDIEIVYQKTQTVWTFNYR